MRSSPRTRAILLGGALAAVVGPSSPQDPSFALELGAGPAERALASLAAETPASSLRELAGPERGFLVASSPLAAEQIARTWEAWGEWLGRAAADPEDAPARAGLCLLALRAGRWEDAWRQVERLGAAPSMLAALLPHLAPGVPLEHAAGPGGAPPALPDGVLLRPALPPELPPGGFASTGPRRLLARAFRVGAALLELELALEPSGVQVDVRHLAGGPARLFVELPEPWDAAIRIQYVDWFRQDDPRAPLAVELGPGSEPVTLYGRFLARELPLPAAPRGELPRTIREGGLWIELDPARCEPGPPRAAALALGRALGVPAGLRAPGDPPPPGPFAGVVLHYASALEGARLLERVASTAEAFLLR